MKKILIIALSAFAFSSLNAALAVHETKTFNAKMTKVCTYIKTPQKAKVVNETIIIRDKKVVR
ncbi:MAG: hypothetical protein H0U75_04965 [Legionella sp.]|nr:hypothetical protein [Legionella sp.]